MWIRKLLIACLCRFLYFVHVEIYKTLVHYLSSFSFPLMKPEIKCLWMFQSAECVPTVTTSRNSHYRHALLLPPRWDMQKFRVLSRSSSFYPSNEASNQGLCRASVTLFVSRLAVACLPLYRLPSFSPVEICISLLSLLSPSLTPPPPSNRSFSKEGKGR